MPDKAERIKKVIAHTLSVDESKIIPGANLNKDLFADSLDVIALVIELEKEFNISIPDEHIPNIRTVQQIVDYIGHAPAQHALSAAIEYNNGPAGIEETVRKKHEALQSQN